MAEIHHLRTHAIRFRAELEKASKFAVHLQILVERYHAAMIAMAPFVVGNSTCSDEIVRQALPDLVSLGWAATKGKVDDNRPGYTLLHHVCQNSKDPRIIELVLSLCDNLDVRDADGKTAVQYLEERQEEIPHVLEAYRKWWAANEDGLHLSAGTNLGMATAAGSADQQSRPLQYDSDKRIGPLTAEQFAKYWPMFVAAESPHDDFRAELQTSTDLGGLGLSLAQSQNVIDTMDCIRKVVCQDGAISSPPTGVGPIAAGC